VSTRRLPANPSLEHLKHQARALQQRVHARDEQAWALVLELHPQPPEPAAFRLAHAQLVIARQYGFPSWPRLRQHLDTLARYARAPARPPAQQEPPEDELLRLACLTYGADRPARIAQARLLLAQHPELARASIHTAAAAGEVDFVRERLLHDPAEAHRLGGPHQWEPLLYVTYGRLDGTHAVQIVQLLLAHGADPNAGFLWEGHSPPFTALTGAFGGGEDAVHQPPHPQGLAIARRLLEAGADPNDDQTLYNRQFAPQDDHLELLFTFGLGRGDGGPWHRRLAPDHATPEDMVRSQLLWAAAHDLPDRVALLLRHGVDRRGLDPALERARRQGNERVMALLREAGATVPADPVEELLSACMCADGAQVEALLQGDPSLRDRAIARQPGQIREAAALGRSGAVRLLASLGFDVNHRERITALHEAASRGDGELVTVLIELGADVRVRDTEFDATPAGWAGHQGHQALAERLRARETSEI
jgi:hypothetical protein